MAKYWSIQGKYERLYKDNQWNLLHLNAISKMWLQAPNTSTVKWIYGKGLIVLLLYVLFPLCFYIFRYITDRDVNGLLSAGNVLLSDHSRAVWICLHRWSEQYRHCSGPLR